MASRERRRAVVVATLMFISFVLGFALVFFLTEQKTGTRLTAEAPVAPVAVATPKGAFTEISDTADEAIDTDGALEEEADAPPEVPPGKTPDGVAITGVLYLKCFDSGGAQYKDAACGELELLERRFASRLYVVDRCAKTIAGKAPEGILSLGVNVDFPQKEIGFWAGPSSEIDGAKAIGSCVRRELAGLPLYDIDAKYARYRLFFTVDFTDPLKLEKKIRKLKRKGRVVAVAKDHVRVRREPVDGYTFGKLSTDSEVTLVGRKDDWCRVVTPSDNEGWMICEALAL